MKKLRDALGLLALISCALISCARSWQARQVEAVHEREVSAPPVIELRGGQWLGPDGFSRRTVYVIDGRLRSMRPAVVDSVIDIGDRYVVPPFGEAHNHNVDYSTPARTDSLIQRYRHDGVFYAKNPGNLPRGRDSLVGRVNVPQGIDAIFANGLLTATGGHPTGLYLRNLARGGMTPADGDGGFLWIIDSLPDLNVKWPRILAQHPDFIKTVLVHSEEFARRRNDTAYFNWRGLDPGILSAIVARAHAANLRVSTHVETSADFHNALAAGVDEINHIPGFRGDERTRLPALEPYEVTAQDAALAARQGVWVVTTVGGFGDVDPNGADSVLRHRADSLQRRNLRTLLTAGVHIAIGSDSYRDDSSNEFRYLTTLGVFDNIALVRLWSEATPQAIFPNRRVGCLVDGCEASFLVLGGNPALDLAALRDIRLRVKDGRVF